MKIKDIMTTDIVSVDKDEDLKHVLDLMKKYDITKIPVVEDKKIVGIVTDNLIAYKLGSIKKRDVSTSRLHASSVTEKDIDIVNPGTNVSDILKKVGKPGPTMILVVENEKLVGVVTKADLLFLVENSGPLESVMSRRIHSVSPDDRIVHARRMMINENIARLLVVDRGALFGIISDIEIAFAFADLKKSFSIGRQKHVLDELLVKNVMKTPVMWTTKKTSINEAAKIMIKNNIGSLPIIEEENLVGMVTRTDLLKTIKLEK
jgi:CBS domain-containing protein